MKVDCPRGILHDAFAVASTVVPQRTTVPAIQNVKINAVKGKGKSGDLLELICTDLEFGLRYAVPGAKVEEAGTLVLPAAKVAGILRESRDDNVSIHADGNLGLIRTQGSTFKVVGIDPADFPDMPQFNDKAALDLSTDDLGEMIRLTAFAVSTEVVRYALTGQLLHLKGKEMRMVASDGKRLALAKGKAGKGKGKAKEVCVIIPPKTLGLLDKVITDDDETVSFNLDETQVRVRTSRAMLFSRLIEGKFPDYEAVIPKKNEKKAIFDRQELLSAVRRVALMAADQARAVKFQFSKGKLVLFTRSQDVGEATVEIPAEYTGGSVDIVFNPDYVVDYLKTVPQERVELHFQDRSTAGVFSSDKNYLYVLMPLTITL